MNSNKNVISVLQRDVVILLGIACLFVYRFFRDSILIFKVIPDYIFYSSVAFLLIIYASWRYRDMFQPKQDHVRRVLPIIGYLVFAAIGLMFFVVRRQKIDIYAFITVFLYIFLAIYFVATKVFEGSKGKE